MLWVLQVIIEFVEFCIWEGLDEEILNISVKCCFLRNTNEENQMAQFYYPAI
jgi:hypothetical protein